MQKINDISKLIEDFIGNSSESVDYSNSTNTLSVGLIVDVDDPLQQGRVRAFVPSLNDDPKKLLHLPWCAYVSPFGGSVNQPAYARGHIPGEESTEGAVHYGFWAIPDIGAHALVGCVNGDIRRRFWLGCFPQHQETNTLTHGRYTYDDNVTDGPLSSDKSPIQPLYNNFSKAFNGQRDSSEWKTRGADYQTTAIFDDPPSPSKESYVDDDYEKMAESESDTWIRDILGEHGYDWTGYKNLGAFLASKVFSWTTPGFHAISMDDRPFNSRMRLRTVGGNQIILDDTNERIYASTMEGKSWIEMDKNGNIDVFAGNRFSVYAENDINMSSNGSIRFKAKQGIYGYAGDTRGQQPLSEKPEDGSIRFHSTADFHIKSEKSLRVNTDQNFYMNIDGTTDINLRSEANIGSDSEINIGALNNINMAATDVTFTISGKGTTIDTLTSFLDDFVNTFNDHSHVDAGANLSTETPIEMPDPITISVDPDETRIAPWTNRVPQHEPWPRVLKQDSNDSVNSINDGYLDNVDWIDQYDNVGESGRKDIGKVEGDMIINRGEFWRR